jgi:hypothetical protein
MSIVSKVTPQRDEHDQGDEPGRRPDADNEDAVGVDRMDLGHVVSHAGSVDR